MQTSPQNGAAYRPDIDGLRAIAVLAVVFYHAAIPGFSGGFVGVDIFFVISGYLITRIIWIESNTGAFSLPGFYIRRIKRIFPALFALLFISSMAAVILLVSSDLLQYGKLLTGVVLFFANFALIKQSNYFDAPAADKPLLHTWSLSVEEQFYAAWPLILLLLKNNISRRNTLYVIAGLAVISLVLAEARLPDYQKDAFYLPWCRAWELLLGAFLAINQLSLHPGRFADSLSMTGICGIGFAIALYDGSTPFPGLAALLPCMGATLIVAAGNSSNPVSRFLSWGPLRFVGLISYSLYLIHWPLFSFSRLYFGEELAPPFRGALVVISFALASLSWRFVEKPWRAAKFSNWRTFSMAVAAMGCFCICGYWFTSSGGLPFRLHEKVLKVEALTNDIAKYCRALDIPEGRGGLACELGAPSIAGYDFVLWGDSHAYHFAPAIHKLAERRDLSGVLFTRWGCHPFLNDPHTSKDCQKFNALVASWIDRNPIKLAILGGRWTNHDKYLRQSVER
ncbi:MAG TPA: acyltransferase family protein, partial [Hyphomicrobiales bacterium]|nr:acyltransferase family protein [Hyphomicrobiales bacterium]